MEKIKAMLAGEAPVKWLFYGDSITHGARHTWGWRDYPELFDERIRCELERTMDVVINTAIGGDTSEGLIESFDWRVAQFRPHVAFVMIGMNDCSRNTDTVFEANLHTLADRFAEIECQPVMQTTCTIQKGGAPEREPYIDAYMQKVRDVAAARSLPLIDHTAHWKQNADKLPYWLDDPFHPDEQGHRAFAHLIFRELGIFDPQSATCRLFVP